MPPELDERAAAYSEEIRSWLVGRLGSKPVSGPIERQKAAALSAPAKLWWLLEGKRYDWLESNLASSWPRIDAEVRRLRSTFNPVWRHVVAPEGETDWVATAAASLTAHEPVFVSKAARSGLDQGEQQALLGWLGWIAACWTDHVSRVGAPDGIARSLPWKVAGTSAIASQQLRRWAHVARRSRWPLLRKVVAESLRCELEPQELDRIPLPSDRTKLFELVCMVRTLRALYGNPETLRWLDSENGNQVQLPGVTYHYQFSLAKEDVLTTSEYSPGLRAAMRHHRTRVPRDVDGLLVFDQLWRGFKAVLIEAKSGTQSPDAAIYQLKAYRAALERSFPGRYLVWGIVEAPHHWDGLSPADRSGDVWVFSDASRIPEVLQLLARGGDQ